MGFEDDDDRPVANFDHYFEDVYSIKHLESQKILSFPSSITVQLSLTSREGVPKKFFGPSILNGITNFI